MGKLSPLPPSTPATRAAWWLYRQIYLRMPRVAPLSYAASKLLPPRWRDAIMAEVTRGLLGAWHDRDTAILLAVFHEQAEIDMSRWSEWPERPIYRGSEGVRQSFADYYGAWEEFDLRPTRFLRLDPDRYLAEIELRARGRASGIEIERRFFQIAENRDGFVWRMANYTDEAEALEAAGVPPRDDRAPHVLILSAAIGEGHDLPARVLAEELQAEAPDVETSIEDGLAAMGWFFYDLAMRGSPFHSDWGNRLFELEYWLLTAFPPTRAFAGRGLYTLGGRGLLRAIESSGASVVVSTYPGVTEVLGRLRRRGRLHVPVVSAITDLAALRFWSHGDVDVHLVTHPESVEEVRQIARGSEAVPVRGLNSSEFLVPRDRLEARRDLGLPEEPKLVVVSGGGWAVGDLEGAVMAALEIPDTIVAVLCGRNEEVQERLERDFAGQERVRVLGFTDHMSDLLAAADALVHSTAGLTVLEAHVRGCPTISYGWGRAHIRANNRAFLRFGLADVAADRPQLEVALRRALAGRREPDLSFAELPSAASVVLGLIGRDQVGDRVGAGEHGGADRHEHQ